MRLSSLFTSKTPVSSVILGIAVFTLSATAQDRTTEQGEAQITGEHFILIPARVMGGAETEKYFGWGEEDNLILLRPLL